MKARWQTKKLGDVCDFEGGSQPPKSQFIFEAKPGYVRFLQIRDFGSDKNITYIPKTKKNRLCGENDILIGRYGASVGKILTNKAGAYNVALMKTIPNLSVLDRGWFYNYLISDEFQGHLMNIAARSAQAGFSKDDIYNFPVPVPPLPEQRRIVAILDEAFDGISTAKTNAEKNLQNVRALFESHLQSVFTQRGKGWMEKGVSELVTEGTLVKPFDGNHGEIHPKKADYTESGVPFIMACDLRNGSVDTVSCKFISRKLADSLRVGFAKDGDVLISHKGTIGRSAIVSTDDDYIMLTPQVTSYRIKNTGRLFNRFVRYYFMSPVFQREIIEGAEDGATRAYIGITKQLTLRFRFPGIDEQHRIAEKLDYLTAEIQRLESIYQQKLTGLEELKKSLLYQTFSGKL